MSSSATLNTILGTSFSNLWSLLNVQQVPTRAPLFGHLKFPGKVLILNEILLAFAALKIFETEKHLDSHLFDLPEDEPFSPSFELCDYESTLLIINASSTVWMYKAHLAMLIVFATLFWLINRCCKSRKDSCKSKRQCDGLIKKIESYFFWNGLIRFFMETWLELALVAVLNMRTVNWSTPSRTVTYSNILAVISLVLINVLSVFLIVCYCLNFKKLNEERFKNKYGSALDGTNTSK